MDTSSTTSSGSAGTASPTNVSDEELKVKLQKKITLLKRAVTTERKSHVNTALKAEKLKHRVDSFETQLVSQSDAMVQMLKENTTLTKEIAELRSVKERMEQEVDKFSDGSMIPVSSKRKKGNGDLFVQYRRLSSKLNVQAQMMQELESSAASKEEMLAQMRELSLANMEIVERENSRLISELKENKLQLKVYEEENTHLNEVLSEANEEKSRLRLAMRMMEQRLQSSSSMVEECTKNVEEMEAKMKEKDAECVQKQEWCDQMAEKLMKMKKSVDDVVFPTDRFPVLKFHRVLPPCDAMLLFLKNPLTGNLMYNMVSYGRDHCHELTSIRDVCVNGDNVTVIFDDESEEPDTFKCDNSETIAQLLKQLVQERLFKNT